MSTDGGLSWSADGSYSYGIGDVSCASSGFCMAVPYGGDRHLVVSTSLGSPWTPISDPRFIPSDLKAVSATCIPSFCIVTGGDTNGNIPPHGTAAFLTTDHGTTWKAIHLPPPMKDIQTMSCMPNGKCYLVYDTYTNQFSDMAISTNSGQSWLPIKHAAGFTSPGGFSCPSTKSCVYLADKRLEVSSGHAPVWTDNYGPFSLKRSKAAYAWTLACSSVTQCMIGGTLDGSSPEQVVWIEAPAWTAKQVISGLKIAAVKTASDFTTAFNETAQAVNNQPASEASFDNLLSVVQGNMATISGVAIHARGPELLKVRALDLAWGALHDTLDPLAHSKGANLSPASELSLLSAKIKAIAAAEKRADVSTLKDPFAISS